MRDCSLCITIIINAFLNNIYIYISTEVVYTVYKLQCYLFWLLLNWCHVKLLPSQHFLCTSLTVQPCKSLQYHFIWSHSWQVNILLAIFHNIRFTSAKNASSPLIGKKKRRSYESNTKKALCKWPCRPV